MDNNIKSSSIAFNATFPRGTRCIITEIRFAPSHNFGEKVFPFLEKFRALWDTGASSTTISNKIAERLKLPILNDDIKIQCPSGTYKTKLYSVGIILPNGVEIPDIQVVGTEQSENFDMLIGMDIITLGDFLISTYNGEPQFSFQIPSVGGFFLDGIEAVKTRKGRAEIVKQPLRKAGHIDRNEPCPCGSGKKYKHCHGKS